MGTETLTGTGAHGKLPPSFHKRATGWPWLAQTSSWPWPGGIADDRATSTMSDMDSPHLHRLPIRPGPADLRDWPILALTVSAARFHRRLPHGFSCDTLPELSSTFDVSVDPSLIPALSVRKSRSASCASRNSSNLNRPSFRCCQERYAGVISAGSWRAAPLTALLPFRGHQA